MQYIYVYVVLNDDAPFAKKCLLEMSENNLGSAYYHAK